MAIPFVDLEAQYKQIKNEVLETIEAVLDSRDFVMGKYEEKFSREFAALQGSEFSVGCSNGTSAITVALRALGIGNGDEVITPANSFFATAEAIVEVGAIPVFVDCLPDTYGMDVDQFAGAITEKTKAVVPVHLYGNPANMQEIQKISKQHGIKIIEDCAQAHLATIDGKGVGTFGDFGTFSFYPGKNLGAYGDAGAVITQSKELLKLSRMHINHGRTKKYEHEFCAGNFRMDGIQAAILSVKAKYIEEWTSKRIAAAKTYDAIIKERGFKTIDISSGAKCVYHLYPVEVSNRDEAMDVLKQNQIACGVHYPIPLHLQPALEYLGYKEGSFPVTELTSKRMVSIPIFPEITKEQIKQVSDVLLEVAKI